MTDKVAYLKDVPKSTFSITKEWRLFEGSQGCTVVNIPEVCLSMEKAPPPLAPLKNAVPPPVTTTTPQPVNKVAQPKPAKPPQKSSAERFLNLLIDLDDKTPKKAQPAEKKQQKLPKPFDLYDTPQALHALGFSVAEKLSKRWFEGRYYLGPRVPTKDGKGIEEGIYDADMVDIKTVTLKWLLGYEGVKKDYDELLKEDDSLKSKNALIEISHGKHDNGVFAKFFKSNPTFSGDLNTKTHCNGDIQKLHKQFQYQHKGVSQFSAVDLDNIKKYAMTDLIASVANFSFYAAVAKATVRSEVYNRYNTKGTLQCVHRRVEVTHVYIYGKDTYTFYDDTKSSQYLGHWNKTGMILEEHALAAEIATRYTQKHKHLKHLGIDFEAGNNAFAAKKGETLPLTIDLGTNSPVLDTGSKLQEKEVYYPVRNSTYMAWREKHKRGGDFIIFTDLYLHKLATPIMIDMGEVCQ